MSEFWYLDILERLRRMTFKPSERKQTALAHEIPVGRDVTTKLNFTRISWNCWKQRRSWKIIKTLKNFGFLLYFLENLWTVCHLKIFREPAQTQWFSSWIDLLLSSPAKTMRIYDLGKNTVGLDANNLN